MRCERVGTRVLLGALLLAGRPERGAAQAANLQDTVALGAFLDGIVATQMQQFRIPSAAVVVVKDGRVVYSRGYGYADIAHRRPVDPATSMFHIGSTGKLFTWTAVMQLVEQKKLDLDTDVNRYLKTFQLPATFPQPITLRHLLTHTAGFQEGLLGYFIGNDSVHVRSIEETLRAHIPARVRPPGRFTSYSNYGASLAGLIIEQVSGEPFAQYIERHVYQPLGIRYATFREPVPAGLRPNVVIGYEPENGRFAAQPPEIDGGFSPSGGTVMSTGDMAKFMIAHLSSDGGGILGAETMRAMHRTAFTHDPRLPGMALGFIEGELSGHRVIGHDGDSQDFHVGMVLLPEASLGVYVAYGATGGAIARNQVTRAFFDRYFPADAPPSTPPITDPVERYAGDYRILRMNYTDIDKVIYAFIPPIRITALASGRLLLTGGVGPDAAPGQFVAVGNHLFRDPDADRTIGFGVDSSGRVTHLFTEPTVDNERVPATESQSLWYPLLGVSAALLLGALIGQVYRRAEIRAMPPAERSAMRWLGVTALWLFLSVAVIGVVVLIYQQSLLERIPFALKAALALPVIYALLTLGVVVKAVSVWRGRFWGVGRRIHYTLVALASVALTWFFYQWNVLGWHFG
jgi:CubicO group peptidase (beta-lactamase class C family)